VGLSTQVIVAIRLGGICCSELFRHALHERGIARRQLRRWDAVDDRLALVHSAIPVRVLGTQRFGMVQQPGVVATPFSGPHNTGVVGMRRLVRSTIDSGENLRRLKDHLHDMLIALHSGRGNWVKAENKNIHVSLL